MDHRQYHRAANIDGPGAVSFRAASEADYPAIVEMTKDIWGGNDYLPSVWHEWVRMPNSYLQVGTVDGEIVTTGRLVEQVPGGWWMEALRVHPAHQGKGYARILHNHLVSLARRQSGIRSLGLATNWDNEKIAHLARSSGMTLRRQYRYLRAQALAEPAAGVERIEQMDAGALMERLSTTRWLAENEGNLLDGWVIRPVEEAWLAEIIRAGGLWRCNGALALIGKDREDGRRWLYLVDGGNLAERTALVRHARHLVYQADAEAPLRAFVPSDPEIQRPLLEAGMHDPEQMGEFYLSHFKLEIASP